VTPKVGMPVVLLPVGQGRCCACCWRPAGPDPVAVQADAHTRTTAHATVYRANDEPTASDPGQGAPPVTPARVGHG
jgi:hypothetical protein